MNFHLDDIVIHGYGLQSSWSVLLTLLTEGKFNEKNITSNFLHFFNVNLHPRYELGYIMATPKGFARY